jgi:urate oxidase
MAPHKHAFKRTGPSKPFANVQAEKRKGQGIKIHVQAGFRGLDVLKTTQSGFVDYHTDKYTSLPPATDRLLGTSVDAEWNFNAAAIMRGNIDFNKVCPFRAGSFSSVMYFLSGFCSQKSIFLTAMQVSASMENALVNTFAGPSDKGVYSKSVQQTLFLMAGAALKADASVDNVSAVSTSAHQQLLPSSTIAPLL